MFKLINENSNIATDDFLEVILGNRGISDTKRFLEPSASDTIHFSKLHNIKEAVALFKEVETTKKDGDEKVRIILIVDQDIDGYCSSAILASYIEEMFPHIELVFLFHEGKQHGITDSKLNEIKEIHSENPVDLLMIADAGTSDYQQQYIISEKLGIPIIVLDHHEAEKGDSEFAIVVNNQLSDEYTNKALSGVGIVYKFLQALDSEYGNIEADNYLDLVAFGNIADSMDLTSPETRYLVYEGLENIENEFLKEIILKHIGDFKRVYPYTLSFSVIPKINGIIRVGSEQERIDLFNAFKGVDEVSYNSRTKRVETLAQKVTRQCTNAYKRQKTMREKWIVKIKEQINEKNLDENAFLLIELEESFDRELGGYLAGALAGEYRKPVLMLVWDSELERYTGSLRGYDGTMKNTKDFLEGLQLFDYLGGHQNACGFKINKEALFKLNGAINSALENQGLTGQQMIDVDFYLKDKQLTLDLVSDVYSYEYLWGKGVSKPLFAIDIEVDTNKIKKSKTSNMIEWYHNDIKFLQFSGDKRLMNLMEDGYGAKLTLVGSISINHFAGRVTPQFLIEELSINEVITTESTVEEKDDLDDLFNW